VKKNKNKNRVKASTQSLATLPQNIMPIGERVYDDKNIYIHQKVYRQIHKFAEDKNKNESGGILVGKVINELGKDNTIIEGFIEAKYNEATPTTLTFTHQTWEYFHSEVNKKYKGMKIVGWIHTHPNFGVFLSENDKFIQNNFFNDVNHVAYVVDPIQNEEGFYFWIGEKLERCPGFYLFDKNGVKIKTKVFSDTDSVEEKSITKVSTFNIVLAVILIIMMAFNIVAMVNMSDDIAALKKENDTLKAHVDKIQHNIQNNFRTIEGVINSNNLKNNDQNDNNNKNNNQNNKQNIKVENQNNQSETGGN